MEATSTTTETIISFKGVSKKFRKSLKQSMLYVFQDITKNIFGIPARTEILKPGEFWALDNVSFEVKKGETLGIIGPNGAGKTTILKLLANIILPDKGSIEIEGKVGSLIEIGAGFHPMLTGRENIYVNGAIFGMSKKEIDKRMEDIIEFADIGDFIDSPVKYYSSGMYVRLGFSIAVHSEPDILLIDEVLAVGDLPFQNKCFNKIKQLKNASKTIIIVSHNLHLMERNTERIIIMGKGTIDSVEKPVDAIDKYLFYLSTHESVKHQTEYLKEKQELSSFSDDVCKNKKNYNNNEFRYGNGKAQIIDFMILNNQGKEVTTILSNETIIFRMKVKFYQQIEKPVFGMEIRTSDGFRIYGTSSYYHGIEIKPQMENDIVSVEFKMNFSLQNGNYFLYAGVSEFLNDEVIPLDRRVDFIYITVTSKNNDTGIVNLNTQIEIYYEALN
ncbi:MAG: ABC transporter ATP-binding protein [Candidatus Omnitrophica bacterium]|nr:ABC transporter ATP-binding protein [Candidatus Omnitrophota bacterium]